MTVTLSSMRTTTFQPSRLTQQLMQNGEEAGSVCKGVVAWCTSCIQDAEGVCAALTVYGGIQVRRGVRAGKKKNWRKPIASTVHRA